MDGELREKVARIIDPEAFGLADPGGWETDQEWAYRRADAILSAIQGAAQPVAWDHAVRADDKAGWILASILAPDHAKRIISDGKWQVQPLFAHPAPEQAGEVERLRGRNIELQSLAYGWMAAHDKAKAGEPYDLPSPADVPELLARAEAAEQALADMKAERDVYRLVAVNQGWNWKCCANLVDEDAYRAHREQHVDDCAVSARARLSKGEGE